VSGGSLREVLAEVYRPLLPGFFDVEAPREEKATCGNCAMCPPAGAAVSTSEEVAYFRPDAKCCTFHPLLPNYLVGAILSDERADMAEGRRRVRERVELGMGVTPCWLSPPRKADMFLKASRRHAFGRSLTLLCPYFERTQGNCTIWRHRESVCSTFFCKHDSGADGVAFWTSVRAYGVWLENTLSSFAARRLIPGHTEPKPLSGDMTLEELEDRAPAEGARAAMWKEWRGREVEFYVRCFEAVRGLSREGFEELARDAAHAERLGRMTAAREAMLGPKVPERVMPNPEMSVEPGENGVLVVTYSRYEPLLLTRDLFEVVRAFEQDGTTSEVVERLRREHGVEVPEELLLGLCRFRVLVPREEGAELRAGRGAVLVHPGS
jgi:Fe-S-cluster containining protein